MNRISERFLQLATVAAIVGMTMGLYMGSKENYTLAPAHAHLNLLGWVSMFMYGLFYRFYPEAGAGKLAGAHFWVNLVSVVVLIPALGLQLLGDLRAVPVVIVSSTAIFVSMLMFTLIVFKATGKRAA